MFVLAGVHVKCHYNDVIMSAMASQITSLTIGYSTVYSGADQKKHQSSASLVFVRSSRCRLGNARSFMGNLFAFITYFKLLSNKMRHFVTRASVFHRVMLQFMKQLPTV